MREKLEVAERDVRYVIEPLIAPPGEYAAHVEWYRRGPRGGAKRWDRLSPRVVADSPTKALDDLRQAIHRDALPQVRVIA